MDTLDAATLQAMLGPQLTAEQARLIFQQGQEGVIFALLTLAKQLAEKQAFAAKPDPATPSGQTPPYVKAAGKRRAKAKGAKPGHPGHRRPRRRGSTTGPITRFRPAPSAMVRFVLASRRGPGSSRTFPPTSRPW